MTVTDDVAGQDATHRRCAFRACAAPLPPPTGRPGNRPKYCQDGRGWGPQGLTCKAAEAAYLAVSSLHGDDPLPPATIAELTARLDATAEPLQALLDAVVTTRAHLTDDVARARAVCDAALVTAAADRGGRELAESDAAQARAESADAVAAASAATAAAAAAAKVRDVAESRAAEAERALVRGEGRLVALEDRLRRAEELTAESSAHTARLETELADALATLRARDEALVRERERAAHLQDGHRADLAAHARTARDEHLAALDEQRAAHRAEIDRAGAVHTAELGRLAEAHCADLARRAAEHAAELDRQARAHTAERGRLEAAHTAVLAAVRAGQALAGAEAAEPGARDHARRPIRQDHVESVR